MFFSLSLRASVREREREMERVKKTTTIFAFKQHVSSLLYSQHIFENRELFEIFDEETKKNMFFLSLLKCNLFPIKPHCITQRNKIYFDLNFFRMLSKR